MQTTVFLAAGGKLVACTKSGKLVGWQLLQAAFDESHTTPCVLHGVDSNALVAPSPGKTSSTGGLNGFNKKAEAQGSMSPSSAAPKPLPERGSSSGSLEAGKSARSSKGLPPVTGVWSCLTLVTISWNLQDAVQNLVISKTVDISSKGGSVSENTRTASVSFYAIS